MINTVHKLFTMLTTSVQLTHLLFTAFFRVFGLLLSRLGFLHNSYFRKHRRYPQGVCKLHKKNILRTTYRKCMRFLLQTLWYTVLHWWLLDKLFVSYHCKIRCLCNLAIYNTAEKINVNWMYVVLNVNPCTSCNSRNVQIQNYDPGYTNHLF